MAGVVRCALSVKWLREAYLSSQLQGIQSGFSAAAAFPVRELRNGRGITMRRDRIITATCIAALIAGCTTQQGLKTGGPVVQESVDDASQRGMAVNVPPPPPPPPSPLVTGSIARSEANRAPAGKAVNGRGFADRERYAGGYIRPVVVPTDPGNERYDGKDVSPVHIRFPPSRSMSIPALMPTRAASSPPDNCPPRMRCAARS